MDSNDPWRNQLDLEKVGVKLEDLGYQIIWFL